MVRTIAPLVYSDRVDGAHIKIGTGSWQIWLSKNKSFRYESFWGSFTAYKEYQGEEIFWIAYRRVQEEIRQADLGDSKNLTVDKLIDTAKKISASDTTPWEGQRQTQKSTEIFSNELEAIPKAKEIETLAVRQWCIFYHHLDGQVEFLGACWEKEHALNRVQYFQGLAHSSESMGGLYSKRAESYEIRQEMVVAIDHTQKKWDTNSWANRTKNKEIELLQQIEKLRYQLSKMQKQLEQERYLNTNNNASRKFIWN